MQEGWSEFAQHAAKVSEFKSLLDLSESDTRAFLIDPVLRLLGYVGVGDIRREVQVKETKEFLDYELRAKGAPCVIVEAKSLKNSVTDSATAQCVQYAAVNGVRWCVITNGVIWAIYDAFAKGPLAQKQVDSVSLDTEAPGIARAWAVLSLMSRQNMEAGGGFTPLLIERVLRDELTRHDSGAVAALRRAIRDRLQESVQAADIASRVQVMLDSTVLIADGESVEPTSVPAPMPPVASGLSPTSMDTTRRVRISALIRANLLAPGDVLSGSDGQRRAGGRHCSNGWKAGRQRSGREQSLGGCWGIRTQHRRSRDLELLEVAERRALDRASHEIHRRYFGAL